jgi:hypothetical protein
VKRSEALIYATTWKNLENMMPSAIRQAEKGKYHMIVLL